MRYRNYGTGISKKIYVNLIEPEESADEGQIPLYEIRVLEKNEAINTSS